MHNDSDNKFIIGLSVGSDPDCYRYNRFAREGFSLVEAGPVSTNSRIIIENIKADKPGCQLALNLQENSDIILTEEDIVKNIIDNFSILYDFADTFTVNISNKNLDYCNELIDSIVSCRLCYDSYKSVLVRLAEELSDENIDRVTGICRLSGIDGLIVSDYKAMIEKVNGNFPVYAELKPATPETVAEARNAGAAGVFAKTYSPKCRFVKKARKTGA